MMKKKIISVACMGCLLWLTPVFAQQTDLPRSRMMGMMLRITTNLVQVDAVVTDRRRHVPGFRTRF
ncbi:MAG: hypothetical protein WKF30_11750 [Pyrinomonadaceae bacterium]